MKTILQVLSENERFRVHEESLKILEKTGVKVETNQGRQILKQAGALVDENHRIVKFPKHLIESSLEMMTKDFTLGARRPGKELVMNAGESTLCLDGDGTMVLDSKTGERRRANYADWENVTRLADALDEIGVYWLQVDPREVGSTSSDTVEYMCGIFRNFSKHVQDAINSAEEGPWYLEILQTIFGTQKAIKKNHPVSYLLCPQSPLMIDRVYTEAYLALKGWNIPVAIMPMPLMGATAPGNMISSIIQGNCEVLSMICLLQANEPGVPIIYSPALAVMNPRTATLSYASMEFSIMDAAVTEMARYYGLPAESSPGGSDAHVLNYQNAHENGILEMPTILSWPDIIVGAGMLDGSMVSSLEKILIDTESFRLAKHAHRGVNTSENNWLTDVISKVGPGGNYLCEPSTASAVRSEDWYISDFGSHETYDSWVANGKKDILEEAREKVNKILKSHKPMPLGDDVEKELAKICQRARELN
jgi:trimethylamine---corrinoid protein Co-methyltransferase